MSDKFSLSCEVDKKYDRVATVKFYLCHIKHAQPPVPFRDQNYVRIFARKIIMKQNLEFWQDFMNTTRLKLVEIVFYSF